MTKETDTLAAGQAIWANIAGHEIHNGNDIVALAENGDDAKRLAACWNACQGVQTDSLVPMALQDAKAGLRSEADLAQQALESLRGLLGAAKRLEARGWFQPNSCADEGALRDMAAMREAIEKAA